MVYIREFLKDDAKDAAAIWNKVVEDGVAFPQLETLSPKEAEKFFAAQDFTGIAFDTETGEMAGLYILHMIAPRPSAVHDPGKPRCMERACSDSHRTVVSYRP